MLFIIVDDFKPLASVFQPVTTEPITPNINALIQRSINFRNAHAQMSMCGPSRVSFLTGLRPDTTNCYGLRPNQLNSRIVNAARYAHQTLLTIPKLFKQAGYLTYGIGKVFHENEDIQMADPSTWTVPVFSWKTGWVRPPTFSSPYTGTWVSSPNVADNYFPDGQAAIFANNLIQSLAAQNQPWAVFLGHWKPHLPFQAPAKYFSMQKSAGAFPGPHSAGVPNGMKTSDYQMARGIGCLEVAQYQNAPSNLAGWAVPLGTIQTAVQAYYAAVTYVDVQIGITLKALANSSAADNTHIVLLGDHGVR